MDKITLILTSSVIAAIVSAIISAIVSIKLKHLDYKNDYYKEIIRKRLNAYQFLETQVAVLKSTVFDDYDNKPYHMIFSSGEKELTNFQKNLFLAISYSIWIDEKTTSTMETLNEVFFHISLKIEQSENLTDLGKEYYKEIAGLRKTLEENVRDDLFNLHNLKKFFKSKTSGQKRIILPEK